jgi:hypothetical protein
MKRTSLVLLLAGLSLAVIAACSGGAASSGQGESNGVRHASGALAAPGSGQPASSLDPHRAAAEEEGLVRRVLYSLEPGEAPLEAESVVGIEADEPEAVANSPEALQADLGGFVLVLAIGQGESARYSVFRDGKKSGPFEALEEAMKTAYQGRKEPGPRVAPCAVYKPGRAPEGSRFEPSEAGGRSGLRFKGQSIGPFVLVYSTAVTPDGSRGYYTAANGDKAFFGCTDGRVVTFGGIPSEFKFSPDGKNAAVLVEGSLSLDGMKNLGQLPPEKMAEAMKDSDKRFLYTLDGRTFGPFGDSFRSYSFWFAAGGNDLYFRTGDGVYRNGALLFRSDSFDACGFYPGADGKSYVTYDYEKIVFSDGRSYPSPLDVVVFARGGRTIFKWLSLENKKDFVVYERAM